MRKIIPLFLLAATLCLCSGCLGLGSTPTEEPAPVLGDTLTRTRDGMVMVYVPAGEFQMGRTEGYSDERPVHTVYLDGFWIDQTEVSRVND
jgi:formylglycine-generating enzyme required for sulfatase activity